MAKRSGIIHHLDRTLEELRTGRNAAIHIRRSAKINSNEYKAAGKVLTAIDELAEQLTSNPTYFHNTGHGGGVGGQ